MIKANLLFKILFLFNVLLTVNEVNRNINEELQFGLAGTDFYTKKRDE